MKIDQYNIYLEEDFPGDITVLGQPGAMDRYVEEYLGLFEIEADPDLVRNYLSEFGAWDDGELADHEANMQRSIWIAACDIVENGEWFFSH